MNPESRILNGRTSVKMTESNQGSQNTTDCEPPVWRRKKSTKERKYFTRRWVLAYLLCVVRICQTALRQCIGMAIVCMTQTGPGDVTAAGKEISSSSATIENEMNTTSVYNTTSHGREFQWSSSFEGHVLASYYYGFLLSVMLAGYVDRGLGSVRTIAAGVAGGGVVNLLTPVLTRKHAYLLVALRVLAGAANGVIDPAIHSLWAHWAPASQRGQLSAVEYAGNGVGGILTFLISAFLCKIPLDNGWSFIFYFYGGISLVFTVVWLFFARDSPEEHPTITDSELKFISSDRSEILPTEKAKPPWLKIIRSRPVWAIIVAHASFSWVFSWILAYLPMYMEEVLHYDMAENGVFSSLPFLGKLVAGIVGGYLADLLLRRHLSIAAVRKTFQMAGSVGCAVPLLVISFLSHEERGMAVVLLILSVSLQNLTSVAYRINSLDIAPRYAGFLMSMTSTIACALTLTAPHVTSALLITKSRQEWQCVLFIVTAVSVLGGVVFVILARGEVQDWARDKEVRIHITEAASPPDEQNISSGVHAVDKVRSRPILPKDKETVSEDV